MQDEFEFDNQGSEYATDREYASSDAEYASAEGEHVPSEGEYASSDAEYAPAGPEYAGAGESVPKTSGGDTRSLMGIGAGLVVAVGTVAAILLINQPEKTQLPPQESGTGTEVASGTESTGEPVPDSTEESTGTEETEPDVTEESEELVIPTEGTIHVTYYNQTLVFETGYIGPLILKEETFDVEGFEGAAIPEPEPYDGYTFRGWVLYGTDGGVQYAKEVSGVLTLEDIALVPVSGDNVYEVGIYGAWYPSTERVDRIILDAGEGSFADGSSILDDIVYGPLASEALYFLEQMFEVPTRDGYRFGGWYAEDGGSRIYAMESSEFYEKNADGSVNYRAGIPVTLKAKWIATK